MNIEYNLTFNNIDYILYLSTNDINLTISLEQASETLYWNGIFDARYLEEITNKAGSPKSFEVFIKMLMSGLANESENVLVDLLSYKDLEMMRNKKTNNTGGNNLNESSSMNQDLSIINKKYLIISYTNEFEKVHYPLPISFILQPDITYTLRTIERLKKLNQKISSQNPNNNSFSLSNRGNITPASSNINNSIINIKDIEELKNENQNLKNKVKLLESQRKLGAVENDEFLRNYSGIKEEYDSYKDESESKIKLLAKTIEDLKLKINYNIDSTYLNDEGANDNKKINKIEKLLKTISELEEKLIKADEIVIKERKTAAQYIDDRNREMEKIKKEIFFMKENEKKLKVKINQLEKDLELANKKTNYSVNSKTKSVKSNYSYKSSVKTSSSKSNYSKESVNSKASNPYDKFKGLYNKNYQPFNFFNKNKSKANSIKSGSYAGSSKGSVYSGISGAKSNSSLSNSKKPPASKFSANKNIPNTNNINKNYSSNLYSKNVYSNVKSSNYNNSINKNSAIGALKNNNYNSSKTGNPYIKNSSNNLHSKNKINPNANMNLKNNIYITSDKQAILGENKNNSLNAEANINSNLSSTLRSNNASRGNPGINNHVKDDKHINQDEINARLGRIQLLLDTAKI